MNVCLVVPPQQQLHQPTAYVPLGLAYIGAVLENDGHDVEVVDLNISNYIPKYKDVYGISTTSATFAEACRISRRLRVSGDFVAVGGIHPSVYPYDTYKESKCNVVFTGEAEYGFRDFLRSGSRSQWMVKCGYVENLDGLPLPARHLFQNVVDRSGIHGQEKGVGATTIISSRGCPYNCTFCTKIPQTSVTRFHSPSRMMAEAKHVMSNYDVSHFRFVDDIFTLNRERIMKLCNTPHDFTFICITRADSLDSELLRNMEKAGCKEVHIGVESGSQKILNAMNKNTTVKTLEDGVSKIKHAGIKVKTYLMYGFPGETDEDRQKTLDFVRRTQPDKATVSKFMSLPGSALGGRGDHHWFYPDEDEEYREFKNRVDGLLRI